MVLEAMHIDGPDEIKKGDLTRVIAHTWSGSNIACASGLHVFMWIACLCQSLFTLLQKNLITASSLAILLWSEGHLSLKLRVLLPLTQGKERDSLLGAHPL